jgi:hypothetical protein
VTDPGHFTQGRAHETDSLHGWAPRPLATTGGALDSLLDGIQTCERYWPSGDEIMANIRALLPPKKEALVHPDDAERITAAIADGDLGGLVNVTVSDMIPPGTLYLYSPPRPEARPEYTFRAFAPEPLDWRAETMRWRIQADLRFGLREPMTWADWARRHTVVVTGLQPVAVPDRARLHRIHAAYRHRKGRRW